MPVEDAIVHTHRHGEHDHEHEHPGGAQMHSHGWHSPEQTCTGDDTFGRELNRDDQMAVPLPGLSVRSGIGKPRSFAVFIPHVRGMLRPGVVEAVAEQTSLYYLVDVSGSQYHYWQLMVEQWAYGAMSRSPFGDVALVEHDIIIPEGCFDGLEACPEPWCVHDYEVFMGGIENKYGKAGAFGVVRFRASIMRENPDLVSSMWDRHWSHLDGIMAAALRARSATPNGPRYESHRHYPDAIHLHDYSHIPAAAREATAALHGVDPS